MNESLCGKVWVRIGKIEDNFGSKSRLNGLLTSQNKFYFKNH